VIEVTDETDWPRLLDEAAAGSVLVERNGVIFRIVREDEDIAAGYDPDPEQTRTMLATVAGRWAHLDVDKMIEDVYAARRAGTRSPDRP
jgi:hypothetical protein